MDEFAKGNPEIVSQTEELLFLLWRVCSITAHPSCKLTVSAIVSIQQIHEYCREAAILCMRSHPNVGLALVRLACELSRDVIRMAADARAEAVWNEKTTKKQAYRDKFKFNLPKERILFDIYKISSEFGVHGHRKLTNKTGEVLKIYEEDYVILQTSKEFIISCLKFNLATMHAFVLLFLNEHERYLKGSIDDPAIWQYWIEIAEEVREIEIVF
jgi:hypothetical protein